jgi:hypothetical protein
MSDFGGGVALPVESIGGGRAQPQSRLSSAIRVVLMLLLVAGMSACDSAPSVETAEEVTARPAASDSDMDVETASKLACAETNWSAPGEPRDLLSAAVMGIVTGDSDLDFEEVFEAATLYCSDLLDSDATSSHDAAAIEARAAEIMDHIRLESPQVVTDVNIRSGRQWVDWNDDPPVQVWSLLAAGTVIGTPTLELLNTANPGSAYYEVMVVICKDDRHLAQAMLDWAVEAFDHDSRTIVQARFDELPVAEVADEAEVADWWALQEETYGAIYDAQYGMYSVGDEMQDYDGLEGGLQAAAELAGTAQHFIGRWTDLAVPAGFEEAHDAMLESLRMLTEVGDTAEDCRERHSQACDRWRERRDAATDLFDDAQFGDNF